MDGGRVMKVHPLALSRLQPAPMQARRVHAMLDDCASLAPVGASLEDFLCALPSLGSAKELVRLRDALVAALQAKRPVLLALGGRAMRLGLGPWAARLLEEELVSAVALTGQALVHDVEMALFGAIAEPNDHPGAPAEVGAFIAEAVQFASEEGIGVGEAVARWLADRAPEHLMHAVLGVAGRFGLPATAHLAPGLDAVQLSPQLHGEALGAASIHDFALLGGLLAQAQGGVVLVLASSAHLPRVLAQAARAASSLASLSSFTLAYVDVHTGTSAVEEMFASGHGVPCRLRGPVEILAPLLFAAVREALG